MPLVPLRTRTELLGGSGAACGRCALKLVARAVDAVVLRCARAWNQGDEDCSCATWGRARPADQGEALDAGQAASCRCLGNAKGRRVLSAGARGLAVRRLIQDEEGPKDITRTAWPWRAGLLRRLLQTWSVPCVAQSKTTDHRRHTVHVAALSVKGGARLMTV